MVVFCLVAFVSFFLLLYNIYDLAVMELQRVDKSEDVTVEKVVICVAGGRYIQVQVVRKMKRVKNKIAGL
jgi:hypothetical protein